MRVEVRDDRERHRFEAIDGDRRAGMLVYSERDGARVLVHTEVDPDYEGQGIAGALAQYALDDARSRGLGVVPRCAFVQAYLARHPDYADLVVPDPAAT